MNEERTDSEEPRVEMEKTRGLRRCTALYIVARRSVESFFLSILDLSSRYIRTPLTISHNAKMYFPNEG